MKNILVLCGFAMFSFGLLGCGGHEGGVIEQPTTHVKDATEIEMESEDYEQAMNDIANAPEE